MLRRNNRISRITFCSAQPATIRFARFALPVTSRRRPSSRLLLDVIEHGITECTHQLPGVDRPDGAKSRSRDISRSPRSSKISIGVLAFNASAIRP